ncbi:MAG: DUF1553 domain-containing protein [Planctomycetota bacterium]|nr:DUF1553 domain-containing protein [Planctomycetota bacterium]
MRTRLLGLLIALAVLPRAAHADADLDAKLAKEKAAIAGLRGLSTNMQFHRVERTVRLLRLSKSLVTDEKLQHVAQFLDIKYLAIVCPKITDAGIAHLAGLTKLDTLWISGTGMTDAGMDHIRGLKQLERLYLDDSAISDAGLKRIAQLANLTTLSIQRTKVTDAGLAHLAGLKNLTTLRLDGNAIHGSGLSSLAELPKLKVLSLAGTQLRIDGIAHLQKLAALEHLTLNQTTLGNDSVAAITKLAQLKTLVVIDAGFSAEAITTLRSGLKKTSIFDGRPLGIATMDDELRVRSAAANSKAAEVDLKPVEPPARERFVRGSDVPDFQRHVLPLLGRLGCNGRACHGSFQGQGGFRLSMFGYDFDVDHKNLTGGDAPRVDIKQPESSLILNKPTLDKDEHGGGRRFEKGGWEYHLLRRWVVGGAKPVAKDAPQFTRLDVTPREVVFSKVGETRPLKAVAVWSDGTREDVTCLTRFQSNDDGVAEVSRDGLVTSTGPGDTYIIAFYDNGISQTQVIHPLSNLTGDRYPEIATPTKIDELVLGKLRKLGVVPSAVSEDEEFLRRVGIDLIGTLPTPDEITAFVKDQSADKRARKIDELLERPAYVTWWTTRLSDLTGSNAGYLGGTEMASVVAEQWRAWIERRVRDNVGWDKIVEGIVLARNRRLGQTYADFIREQSRFTARIKPTDYTALDNPMPHYWFRSNQTSSTDKALTFGYTFLAVRLQCAQCHKHPYDQWSQQDFEKFTQFFTRIQNGSAADASVEREQMRQRLGVPVKLNTAALRRQSYLRIAAEGNPIPWKEIAITPPRANGKPHVAKLLADEELDLNQYDDPRVPLMRWLLDQKNLYFARAFVNRIWANYFNVGIIDPPDDLNLANPPSNRELLDHLAAEFVNHDYDMKWLHRTIARSHTYQRSWRPTPTNKRDQRNFSHAIVRRLPAEVAMDAVIQATANSSRMGQVATDVAQRKIGQHPRSYQARAIDYSLLIFGKPLRTTTCDCERKLQPTLLQALFIRNDSELLGYLERRDGWLFETSLALRQPLESEIGGTIPQAKPRPDRVVTEADVDELISNAYLRVLSRRPDTGERKIARQHIAESANTVEGLRNVMWALLNTQEFITNH